MSVAFETQTQQQFDALCWMAGGCVVAAWRDRPAVSMNRSGPNLASNRLSNSGQILIHLGRFWSHLYTPPPPEGRTPFDLSLRTMAQKISKSILTVLPLQRLIKDVCRSAKVTANAAFAQPKATIIYRLFLRRSLPLATLAFALAAVLTSPVSAQTNTNVESGVRKNPAPWRPSFGSFNPNAQNSQPDQATAARSPSIVNQPRTNSSSPNAAGTNTSNPLASVQPASRFRSSGRPGMAAGRGREIQPGVTRVSKTLNELPRSAGQVWREYDITPYTSQITSTDQPEKAVLDWVLRETGTEMWFTQPMGVLNVDRSKIYVYHTPEIQTVVKGIVDRFVRTKGQIQKFDVNLVTVAKPNWRSQAYTMLQPIEVKSPGVEAWLVSKENAAILMGQLSRRSDFKKHSAGRLTNHDGQSFALDKTRPVQFIRSLRWTPGQIPNYQPLMTTLNEGYKLQLSCLTTVDNASIEATIKCDVDQVEKLNNVKVPVPSTVGEQDVSLQIPQMVSWRLHERFRWPSDEVLVLSCGVVANPTPEATTSGFRLPGLSGPKRADALLFIDYRGPATGATIATVPDATAADRRSQMGRIRN